MACYQVLRGPAVPLFLFNMIVFLRFFVFFYSLWDAVDRSFVDS